MKTIEYKVSEKRKQDLILLATHSRNIKVEGTYFNGCQLTFIRGVKNDVLQVK